MKKIIIVKKITKGAATIALSLNFGLWTSNINAQSGAALNFDGVNDRINCGNTINTVLNSINTITIEAKVYSTTLAGSSAFIGNWNGGPLQFLLKRDGNEFGMFANTAFLATTGGQALLNTWQHVAGTWDGTTMRIYVNGVEVSSQAYSAASFDDMTNTVNIGYNNGLQMFSGNLDEIRVWSVVRTASELSAIMNCEIPTSAPGLIANYHFNQGVAAGANTSDTLLFDLSGNNNNGTLTNFTLTGATSNWVEPGGVASGISCVDCPADQTILVSPSTICSGSSSTVTVGPTQTGMNYTLRDNANNAIIAGPTAGTGSPINFSTGVITNTTTYNVLGAEGSEALSFTQNTSEHLNCGTNLNFTSSLTLELWVNPASFPSPNTRMIENDFTAGYYFGLGSGGIPECYFNNSFVGNGLTSLSLFTNQHVALVFDDVANTVKFFINGVPTNTVAYLGTITGTTLPTLIGKSFGGTSNTFDGVIDEVRIWNIARNDAEILANYNTCLTGAETGLMAYFQMNENTGTTVADISGNGNIATLTNMNPLTDWVGNISGCASSNSCLFQMTTSPTITVNPLPTVTANATATTVCLGTSVTLTGIGAVSYTWTGGVTDGVGFVPSTSVTYSVTGTDTNSCSNTATISVNINPIPAVTTTLNGAVIIADQTGAAYQWLDCNGNLVISGATNQSYNATANGNYAVIVTLNGCSDTSLCVNVSTVGINETVNTNQLTVYPNPSNGVFTIQSANEGIYYITNELGQNIQSFKLNAANKNTITVENLSNGVYFIVGSNNTRQMVVVTK